MSYGSLIRSRLDAVDAIEIYRRFSSNKSEKNGGEEEEGEHFEEEELWTISEKLRKTEKCCKYNFTLERGR